MAKRPLLITLGALPAAVLGAMCVIVATWFMLGPQDRANSYRLGMEEVSREEFLRIAVPFYAVAGVLLLTTAYGLWRGRAWSRLLVVSLSVVGLIGNLILWAISHPLYEPGGILQLFLVTAGGVWYFYFKRNVAEYLGGPSPRAEGLRLAIDSIIGLKTRASRWAVGVLATGLTLVAILAVAIAVGDDQRELRSRREPSRGDAAGDLLPQIVLQSGHSKPVLALAFGPAGRLLATGGQDGTIRLWEVASGRELRILRGHSHRVTTLTFSADGRVLASGGDEDDPTVRTWDVESGEHLAVLSGHGNRVDRSSSSILDDPCYFSTINEVRFLPGDKELASASSDCTIRIWDVASGRQLRSIESEKGVEGLGIDPAGRFVVGSDEDGVQVWDLDRGTRLRSLRARRLAESWIPNGESLALSPDGRTVAVGGQTMSSNVVILWNVQKGLEEARLSPDSALDGLYKTLAFSQDGRFIIAGDQYREITIWDVSTGRQVQQLADTANITATAVSPDGRLVASGNWDNQIKIWDWARGRVVRVLEGASMRPTSLSFGPDGQTLAVGVADYRSMVLPPDTEVVTTAQRVGVFLWYLAGSGEVRGVMSRYGNVHAVAISPDGRLVASGSDGRAVTLWSTETERPLRTVSGHSLGVESVAFSSDSSLVASGSADGTARVWEARGGRSLSVLHHSGPVGALTFVGRDRVIATAAGQPGFTVKLPGLDSASLVNGEISVKTSQVTGESSIKLWHAATGKELRTLHGHEGDVFALASDPTGRLLASGGVDGTIKLWDVGSGAELRTLAGHGDWPVASLTFDPDGRLLASAGFDSLAKLWEVATGRELQVFRGHQKRVNAVAFQPGGALLATGSDDGTTRLWDRESGCELARLIAFDGEEWLVFTPDGLFDGPPNAWRRLLWRVGGSTLDVAPVEAFFKEYFRPGLLGELAGGGRPTAPQGGRSDPPAGMARVRSGEGPSVAAERLLEGD